MNESFYLNDTTAIDQFFHLEPFGSCRIDTTDEGRLLPRFREEGTFYIGLTDAEPSQTIYLLLQLIEGSGNPARPLRPQDIKWSYLAGENWKPLQGLAIETDTTRSFQASGLLGFAIGKDASQEQQRMPSGFTWLRAEAAERADGACRAVALHTQAMSASRLIDEEQPPEAGRFVLPQGKITKLQIRDAAIKSIAQPYASFGGAPLETDELFYARVSERLRHRQRAINNWDYERLVLEAFPEIYKIKCVNHSAENTETVPGAVSLVAVQNQINQYAVNPLEPMLSTAALSRVKEFIRGYASPHANIQVQNPVYEQIRLDFKVGFHPGIDAGYYSKKLNEEIVRFLSPWAFAEGQDIVIGGRIHRSEIIHFIENREYVDFVGDLKLFHLYDGPEPGGIGEMELGRDFIVRDDPGYGIGIDEMEIERDFIVGEDFNEAVATDPRAILVSYPQHYIEVLRPGAYFCQGSEFEGIGFMWIGYNFEVFDYPYAIGNMEIAPYEPEGEETYRPGDFIVADEDSAFPGDPEEKINVKEWLEGLSNPPGHRVDFES